LPPDTATARKFPRHFGPEQVAFAERVFSSHGVWAVFFGRFVAGAGQVGG
jgi:membrane protein DedA with SNARE-associated domain